MPPFGETDSGAGDFATNPLAESRLERLQSLVRRGDRLSVPLLSAASSAFAPPKARSYVWETSENISQPHSPRQVVASR